MSADVVRAIWLEFTEALEGGPSAPVIYQDIRGKVTGPYGYLCDSASAVAALALDHPDGRPATAAEKVAAFHAVKNDPYAAKAGWRRAATLSALRFSLASMHAMALERYDSNDRVLRARCPDWDTLPACARCALHSLAWACGPHAHFPRLFTDVNARDFDGASVEIHMNEYTPEGIHNAGLVPRNVRNKLLMKNAQRVDAFHLDPDLLDWVHDLEVSAAPTLREFPSTASSPSIFVDCYIAGEGVDDPDDAA